MREPRISSRRPLQLRERLVSLKANGRLWLLCVECKALLAKAHSREKRRREGGCCMDTRSEALLNLQKTISQVNICTTINRHPMSVRPVVTIKSN